MTNLPVNSLTVGFGFSLINIQVLPSATPQTLSIDMTIENDKWYTIKTVLSSNTYTFLIDGTQIASVDATQFQGAASQSWGTGSLTKGSVGFSPWYGQSAYYKDVTVTAQDGTTVFYSNPMTSDDILYEYSVGVSLRNVCLDGPKRDREVWIGDFAHTARSISTSSGRFDFIKDMIALEFDFQAKSGQNLVPINSYVGNDPDHSVVDTQHWFDLGDYQFFFLTMLGEYFATNNDKDLVSQYWDQTKALVQTLIDTTIDPSTHLAQGSTTWFLAQGEQQATAPTALFVQALRSLSNIASVLGDTDSKNSWTALAKTIQDAINLTNFNGNAYGISTAKLGVTGVAATAFTILSGVATDQSSSGSIGALSLSGIGYMDHSDMSLGGGTQLSPNTQGFLLESLFQAYLNLPISIDVVMPALKTLTQTFWPAMTKAGNHKNYTGASWEYIYSDGRPGIDLFTSLGHPWGSAPTYVYTNYLLGVRTRWNEDLNAYEWIFDPVFEVATGLGLTWVNGTVPLASGGYIQASWSANSGDSTSYTSSVKVVGNDDIQILDLTQSS